MQRNLCDRIIRIDRNIRFVGIVNDRGEVIEGGFQDGIEPLLDGTDEQQMYMQSLSNIISLQQFRERLGKVIYSITEHQKVSLLTIPIDRGLLCISASNKIDPVKIKNKVLKLLSSGSVKKATKSSQKTSGTNKRKATKG